MGIFDLFTIGFGAIIGVGWAITIGEWFNKGGGPMPTALAFFVAALCLIPVAKAYGELTAAMPVAGGAVVYVEKGCNLKMSYYTGWFLALAYIMLCPWEVIAIAQLLEVFMPFLKNTPLYAIQGYVVYAPSLALSLVVCGIVIFANQKGIDVAVKLQKFLIFGILLAVLIAGVVSCLKGSLYNILPITGKTFLNPKGTFLQGFLSVLAITPFFYSGFDTISQESEECHNGVQKSHIGWVMSVSIAFAALFYIVVIFIVSISAPWNELLTLSMPAIQLYEAFFSLNWVTLLIAFAAFCGLVTTLNSFYAAGARVLLALGRSNMIHPSFASINPETQTPVVANIFVGFITIIGAFLGKSMLLPLTNVCSVGFLFTWLMVAVAALRLRKLNPNMERPYKIRKTTIIIAIIMSLALLSILIIPGSPGALSWPFEILIMLVWLLLGTIQYRKQTRKP
ncbi:MAG: APC family permease [Firmicutes bacterium]|nr:APC family permease [Bacillota bacterium]